MKRVLPYLIVSAGITLTMSEIHGKCLKCVEKTRS